MLTQHSYPDTLDANPPIQPKGGTMFLYDLGLDEAQWEVKKKKLRQVELVKGSGY